jgi:deoxyhypusine synthase
MKPVKQIKISKITGIKEMINEMSMSGVMGAGRLAKAAKLVKEMTDDKGCIVFLGVAGAMVPGGMRQIIYDLIDKGYIHVFVTTGANLTHDLVEALGHKHYQGNADADDRQLNEQGIDRIYDSYMPNEVYPALEDFFKKHGTELSDKKSIKDFLHELGRLSPEGSILHVCYKKNVPVFCPALADSGIGLMIWNLITHGNNINIGAFSDINDIIDIAWTSKKTGVIYIGGGVPKNFIQQAMQFSRKASYGVQITMDRPEPGGSSGASLSEGISWGKMNKDAKFVDLICDATIALPIIYAYLIND